MANNIVPFDSNSQSNNSPFDSIRHVDEAGREYWSARDLMNLLAYLKWQNVEATMTRTVASLKASGHKVSDHVTDSSKLIGAGKGAKRKVVDYRLSRFGCYMFSMNGDPTKPEVARAQSYFAVKTREAEVVIPVLSEELQKLQLQNENMRLELEVNKERQRTLSAAGLMALSAPALVEAILLPGVTIIEKVEHIDRTVVIDRSGSVVSQLDGIGITAISKQFGFKTTKQAWEWLEAIGYGKDSGHWKQELTAHETAKLDRSVMADLKAKFAQHKGDRQKLLGE